MTDLEQFADWWWQLRLPVRYFQPHEMFATGSSQPELWHPPPPHLWLAIIPTVLVADIVRHEFGHGLRVTSAYRPPGHNAAVGGAKNSQHKLFTALDLVPLGSTAAELFDVARTVREDGPLAWNGGLGGYSSFIHIDTRREGGSPTWRH